MSRAALFALAALVGCGGADRAPSAAIVELSPASLDPSRDDADDLTLRVAYADGDADLGGGSAAVHDCRAAGLVAELVIPPLASQEAIDEGVPIEGILELVVSDIGWVAPEAAAPAACAELGAPDPAEDTAVFCVILTAAAGRTGDGDCSDPVAIASPL